MLTLHSQLFESPQRQLNLFRSALKYDARQISAIRQLSRSSVTVAVNLVFDRLDVLLQEACEDFGIHRAVHAPSSVRIASAIASACRCIARLSSASIITRANASVPE